MLLILRRRRILQGSDSNVNNQYNNKHLCPLNKVFHRMQHFHTVTYLPSDSGHQPALAAWWQVSVRSIGVCVLRHWSPTTTHPTIASLISQNTTGSAFFYFVFFSYFHARLSVSCGPCCPACPSVFLLSCLSKIKCMYACMYVLQ